MIKAHDFRDDISAEAFGRHLAQFGLDAQQLIGQAPSAIPMLLARRMGMDQERMGSYAETVREFIRAFRALRIDSAGLNRIITDLDALLIDFESRCDMAALEALLLHLKAETVSEFRAQLLNTCFISYLQKHSATEHKENICLQLLSWLFELCKEGEGRTFIWSFMWEELDQPLAINLVQKDAKRQPSFKPTSKMMEVLSEEQQAIDPIIDFLLPLSQRTEKELRGDIHAFLQSLFAKVNRLVKPGFEHPRAYYLAEARGIWKPFWENCYNFMMPFFGWPDLEAFQLTHDGASEREFDDYRNKKITRLFPVNRSRQKT